MTPSFHGRGIRRQTAPLGKGQPDVADRDVDRARGDRRRDDASGSTGHSAPSLSIASVISTGGSSWAISVCYEDCSGTYPSPNSSAPTAFNLLTGSSNQVVTVGA